MSNFEGIMKSALKILGVSLFVVLLSLQSYSQNFGLGVSAMYNFQSEGIGFGVRGNFFPNNRISYVPQITYYPGFNKVAEYMAGLSIEYKVIRGNKFNFYLMAHGAYNHWLNPEESALENAQTTNWNLEGGIGITTNKCLRPFLEYRYNIKFMETHLRLGLLFIFGCSKGGRGNGYRDARSVRNASDCRGF